MKYPRVALAAIVIVHLVIMAVHGAAHAQAGVALGPLGNAFVLIVIGIGPLAGLIWSFARLREGSLLVAATMGASLVFGLVNHFLIPGPDHVAHVAGPARAMFGVSAALLMVSEALGVYVGWRSSRAVVVSSAATSARA